MKLSLQEKIARFDRSSKIIKLFNPNKSREEFGCPPRLCINTYVGCSHQCVYCYNHWMKGFDNPHEKAGFKKALIKDIEKVYKYGLEDLIVSISNSTDPLQEPIESNFQHSLYALRTLGEKNIKVLILTKNPKKLLVPEYFNVLNPENVAIQVTIPFLDEKKEMEVAAPPIRERIESVKELIKRGISKVSVRVDPLIPVEIGGPTDEELSLLIRRLSDAGVVHVISKVFRLVGAIQKRYPEFYENAKKFYIESGAKWYKNHYMLPMNHRSDLLKRLFNICSKEGVQLSTCYENVSFQGTIKCDMAESKLGVCRANK